MSLSNLCSLRRLAVALAVATGLSAALSGEPAAAQIAAAGQTYLLAVAVCPPYRKDIPTHVCTNGAKTIAESFGDSMGIAKSNIFLLTDEKSSGQNFLKTLADLRGKLTENDRLILYLNAHGDAFKEWTAYYDQGGAVAEINKRYETPNDYILVFWTKEEPTVPVLALAEKDWLTVEEVVDAIEQLPSKVALILESCSSSRVFTGFHRQLKRSQQIDFIVTSAGAEQVANIAPGQTMPLFTQQLTDALDMPMVQDFGAALTLARITTTQIAVATCAMQTFPRGDFAGMFPGMTVPNETDQEGDVSAPLWFCSQVPDVVDFSGEMTNMPLYKNRSRVTASR